MDPNEGVATRSISRRAFVSGGSALVLGVSWLGCAPGAKRTPNLVKSNEDPLTPRPAQPAPATRAATPARETFAPDAFVRISTDDTVTVVAKHIEMGQGPYTGLTTLVAEELDADWSQMRVVAAPADHDKYKHVHWGVQGTGGSSAIANSYYQMRNAGAAARQMLVEAAAAQWNVPPAEVRVSRGLVVHLDSGQSARFGELVAAAREHPLPENPRLKDPDEFVFIGRELPRIDSAAKSDGSAKFTTDAYRDDMLNVVIARPPKFGASVTSFDASTAEATAGVVAVREVPEGVAVYARDTWSAIQGRRALSVEWNEDDAETRSSEQLLALFRRAAETPGLDAARRGDVDATIAEAGLREDTYVAEAEYAFPYLAHASMEPLDALIEVDPESDGSGVLVSYGCQGPGRDHPAIAKALGLPLDKVRLEVLMAGGSFGRRSQHDSHFANEIAHVFAAQPGQPADRRPTKLLWTRDDDIRGGYYRPMVVHRLRGAMQFDGTLLGWDQTIAAQSFVDEAKRRDGIDRIVVEGASNLAYGTRHLRVSQKIVDVGVPTLWWRSVGHTHTGFAVEAFIDELLEGVGGDPVYGRLRLLTEKPRHHAVLTRVAELANWGRKPAEGSAFGVAVHESFGTVVAQIVEVQEAETPVRRPRVSRVYCAVDCGVAVNPNVIRAQMEGGIGFGLGAALYSEINLEPGGRVREGNFDRYRNLRIDDMPEVDVAIIASNEDPSGVGEPGVPPIAPAVADAWRKLTGERAKRLPFVRNV